MKTTFAMLTGTALTALTALAGPVDAPKKRGGYCPWKLVDDWSGRDFFSHWTFYNESDPTRGNVIFLDEDTAWHDNLIEITSLGHAIMRVETTKNVTAHGGRKAIRLHGERNFSSGLVLMDSYHLPTGCGTWPAWWSFNLDWPYHGEIDILEGIHRSTQNKVSIHSGENCSLPNYVDHFQQGVLDLQPSTPFPGFDAYDCFALNEGGSGCGVLDETSDGSYGEPFNKQKGGIYALLWTTETIQVYFFPRHSIPSDIECDKPDPTTWPTPIANFTSPTCSPEHYFNDHFSVFDTTLCGQWAGNITVWQSTEDGQKGGSCAQQTGYATREEYVLNEGRAFEEAYWEIGYVKYFNQTN